MGEDLVKYHWGRSDKTQETYRDLVKSCECMWIWWSFRDLSIDNGPKGWGVEGYPRMPCWKSHTFLCGSRTFLQSHFLDLVSISPKSRPNNVQPRGHHAQVEVTKGHDHEKPWEDMINITQLHKLHWPDIFEVTLSSDFSRIDVRSSAWENMGWSWYDLYRVYPMLVERLGAPPQLPVFLPLKGGPYWCLHKYQIIVRYSVLDPCSVSLDLFEFDLWYSLIKNTVNTSSLIQPFAMHSHWSVIVRHTVKDWLLECFGRALHTSLSNTQIH